MLRAYGTISGISSNVAAAPSHAHTVYFGPVALLTDKILKSGY
jgi:hypothetical protein